MGDAVAFDHKQVVRVGYLDADGFVFAVGLNRIKPHRHALRCLAGAHGPLSREMEHAFRLSHLDAQRIGGLSLNPLAILDVERRLFPYRNHGAERTRQLSNVADQIFRDAAEVAV